MKPPPLEYRRAESVEEAVALLAEGGEDAKILAGGQSLVPLLNMRVLRPSLLVDVNRIPGLDDVVYENGRARVGATVRQADRRLREHSLARRVPCPCRPYRDAEPRHGLRLDRPRRRCGRAPARADAARRVGRRRLAARAARDPGREFFLTHFTTALAPDEVVVETLWPREEGYSYAFEELALRHGDYALCMAAVAVDGDRLRVALGAVVDRPTLVEVDPEQPGRSAAAQVEPWGNVHTSPGYQRHLVQVLVDRAVERARRAAA